MDPSSINEEFFMAKPITPIEDLKSKAAQSMRYRMEVLALQIQAKVCKKLEEIDGKSVKTERWERKEGGGFVACVLENGNTFEKVGITTAIIEGQLPPQAIKMITAKENDLDANNTKFYSVTVGGIIHPANPHIPAMQFNCRYFEAEDATGKNVAWFGGIHHLLPYYLVEEDVAYFHNFLKDACNKHSKEYYPKFKKWADEYFHNSFRDEHQGVGGIFYDDFSEPDLESCFNFVSSCCDAVLPSYIPIVKKHMGKKYSETEKQWQEIRRGRNIEFNLVCDRGIRFGFSAPGIHADSFLLVLPFTAKWKYMHTPEEGSEEHKMLEVLKKPREWAQNAEQYAMKTELLNFLLEAM